MSGDSPNASRKTQKRVAGKRGTAKATKPGRSTAKSSVKKSPRATAQSGSARHAVSKPAGDSTLIDRRIRDMKDWRGETLARMRALILETDPGMIEEVKWRKPSNSMLGIPVWSHNGIVCTGETYKKVVKLTFAHGASIPDPSRLFNASLEGNTRRAIDIHEGEKVDARAFKALVKAAVALNGAAAKPDRNAATGTKRAAPNKTQTGKKVVLLSGGNPQIAKADGDAPVQAYIAAMPSWKRDVGRRLDALIVRTVPNVRKAVRWNSPFYGMEGQGWFLGFHVFTRYIKVTFFRGTSLKPVPPGGTGKDARWIDIHEDDLDEAQMAKWIRQAAAIPGWGGG